MKRRWAVLVSALLCAGMLSVPAGAVVEPTEAYYVADYADVLTDETEQHIIEQNQDLFEATGGQIVVVTVDFMDGMDSADYAMAVAENWGGIGDAERDNGCLLVYAVGENKVWAMAGAGIEDALTASKLGGYLEDFFYERYDAGEYDQATRDFFDAVCGWYESYYAGTVSGSRTEFYYPKAEHDRISTSVGPFMEFWAVILVLVLIAVVCAADGVRYHRYRRRYMMPGMPPPPFVYRPFLFGHPSRHRPPRGPRPPRSGGSFRGGGAGRRSFGGSKSSFGGRAGRGSFGGSKSSSGGGFRGGGSFRGGGAGRR